MKPVESTVSLDSLELDFQHYWLLLKRRWIPAAIVFGTTLIVASIAISLGKPVYKTEGKILVDSNRRTFFSSTGLGLDKDNSYSSNLQVNPLKTQAEVMLSIPLMQRTIDVLELKDEKGKALKTEILKESLDVKNVTGTDVLQVSYKSKNPQQAAAVVNTIMDSYIYSNIFNDRIQATAARKFIDEQLPKTEANVQQADAALRKFKEQNKVTNLDDEEKTVLANISDLDNQITKVKTDLNSATISATEIPKKLGIDSQQAIALSTLSQSPGIQQLFEELQLVEQQLKVARTRYNEQFPQVTDLQRKQAALKAVLQQRVAGQLGSQTQLLNNRLRLGEVEQKLIQDFVIAQLERQTLSGRLQVLSEARDFHQRRANSLPRIEQDQRELQRRLEASQSTYETLLKKLQEVQIAEKQNMGNARIIQAAVIPDKPSNSKILLVLLALIVSTLLAIITVIILELRDPSLKTTKQVSKLFGYAYLGSIPYVGIMSPGKNKELPSPQLLVGKDSRSPVKAAYRMLQARLNFISSNRELKIVVVTSSVPREGKSTICANLALTVAQLGCKVLLVDADLHCPSQQRIWNLNNTRGLSNILVDQVEKNEIPHVDVEKVMLNLDVITAGISPDNPLALLNSRQMTSLVQSFSRQYDFVIIDSPPLNCEPEALILGKITDGILLVVRPGVVDAKNALTAKELLEQSEQNVLGMIVNGSALENNDYAGYQSRIASNKKYDQLARRG